jgi:hypothetical protein
VVAIQALGQGTLGRDVLVQRHVGYTVAGKKRAVQHDSWRESGHLAPDPHAALDVATADVDDPRPAGDGQHGQA